MKREDFTNPPCQCIPCQQAGVSQAGVSQLEQIRDRYTGAFLHGYDLRRWHEARAAFQKAVALIRPKEIGR